jgi:hypothetical protein
MIEIKRLVDGVVLRTVDADTLSRADLPGANLTRANLPGAKLSGANLFGADLSGAKLFGADLSGANLTGAKLFGADLSGANLTGANLSRADLSRANLTGANISQTIGLLNASDWLSANFEHDADGLIVYRGQNSDRSKPDAWMWAPGAVLTENANTNRFEYCGCGVAFATPAWLLTHRGITWSPYWRCRIRWIDLAGVVVPYNTGGEARCERLGLIGVVSDDELASMAEVPAVVVEVE